MARRVRQAAAADVVRLREDAGVTRAELARASGVDPSFLRRIELGAASASPETYAMLAVPLGADLALRLYPNTGPTIRDRHQARIEEALLAQVHPRWRAFAEVAVRRPSRGWIDLGFHDPQASLFLATEIQSDLRRLEQMIRWSAAKVEALPSWEGWGHLGPVATVSKLLVVRSTRATREVAREFRRLLAVAYPGDPEDALAALRGTTPWPGDAMLWCEMPPDAGPMRFVAGR